MPSSSSERSKGLATVRPLPFRGVCRARHGEGRRADWHLHDRNERAIVWDMKLKGTIRRSDLEGGHRLLEASDGTNYQLVGATSGCKDGMKAEVEGKVDKNA